MRLFYINYADLSVAYGATVCIVELAKALAKQGHEVTVVAPQFKRSAPTSDGFDLLTIPNRNIRFLRKVWFYLASTFWVTLWALRRRPNILYWGVPTNPQKNLPDPCPLVAGEQTLHAGVVV